MKIDMASQLSDDDLIAQVKALARCEREATACLIAHLAELDARRLYLPAGFSSLFTYCRLCVAPHKRGYVAAAVMWRNGPSRSAMAAPALANAT
jgi:hypothetical protein